MGDGSSPFPFPFQPDSLHYTSEGSIDLLEIIPVRRFADALRSTGDEEANQRTRRTRRGEDGEKTDRQEEGSVIDMIPRMPRTSSFYVR